MNNFSLLDIPIAVGLFIVFTLLIIFLIFREFNCWYWKINEHISLQEEQNQLLNKILKSISNEEDDYSPVYESLVDKKSKSLKDWWSRS